MELSSSNIKKKLYFLKRKLFLYFLKKKTFLIFSYISGSRIPPPKKIFIFKETETLKRFSYFRKMELLSPSPKNKKICTKRILIFQEIELSYLKN